MNIQRLFLSLSLAVSHRVWLIDEAAAWSPWLRPVYVRTVFVRNITISFRTSDDNSINGQ